MRHPMPNPMAPPPIFWHALSVSGLKSARFGVLGAPRAKTPLFGQFLGQPQNRQCESCRLTGQGAGAGQGAQLCLMMCTYPPPLSRLTCHASSWEGGWLGCCMCQGAKGQSPPSLHPCKLNRQGLGVWQGRGGACPCASSPGPPNPAPTGTGLAVEAAQNWPPPHSGAEGYLLTLNPRFPKRA